jgi:hypothetical protein
MNVIVVIALAAVFIILVLGLYNMMRGQNAGRSQNLMRLRVIAQGVAILVVMLALWLANNR